MWHCQSLVVHQVWNWLWQFFSHCFVSLSIVVYWLCAARIGFLSSDLLSNLFTIILIGWCVCRLDISVLRGHAPPYNPTNLIIYSYYGRTSLWCDHFTLFPKHSFNPIFMSVVVFIISVTLISLSREKKTHRFLCIQLYVEPFYFITEWLKSITNSSASFFSFLYSPFKYFIFFDTSWT